MATATDQDSLEHPRSGVSSGGSKGVMKVGGLQDP